MDRYEHDDAPEFIIWTEKRVYFPVMLDCSALVGSAPRDPCENSKMVIM